MLQMAGMASHGQRLCTHTLQKAKGKHKRLPGVERVFECELDFRATVPVACCGLGELQPVSGQSVASRAGDAPRDCGAVAWAVMGALQRLLATALAVA